jgi:hypothetical protein
MADRRNKRGQPAAAAAEPVSKRVRKDADESKSSIHSMIAPSSLLHSAVISQALQQQTAFEQAMCEKWVKPSSARRLDMQRARLHDELAKSVSVDLDEPVDQTKLIRKLFVLYDQAFLNGALGKLLFKAGRSIQVVWRGQELHQNHPREELSDFQLFVHLDVLRGTDFPILICGITCVDALGALQVAMEHQIAHLLAETGCNERVKVDWHEHRGRANAFAHGLFRHTHVDLVALTDSVSLLPTELVDLIGRALSYKDLVSLGTTSRRIKRDLAKVPIGDKIFDMNDEKTFGRIIGVVRRIRVHSEQQLDTIPDTIVDLLIDGDYCGNVRHIRSGIESVCFKATRLPMSILISWMGDDRYPPSAITFGSHSNPTIEALELPSSLTHLTFGMSFGQPFEKLRLPNALKFLCFTEGFDRPIEQLVLPKSLTHLELTGRFNQPVEQLRLPASLTHLTFGKRFNQPVEKLQLPASLAHLTFSYYFNRPVEKLQLPVSLTHLTFGSEFNHPIEELLLPKSLTHFEFSGSKFKQSIQGVKWPTSLTHLDLGSFKQSIENIQWPASLTYLDGYYVAELFEGRALPVSLRYFNKNKLT